MNREIKFEYIFKNKATNKIEKRIYTIEELEDIEMEIIIEENYFEIVARRMFTGLKDKNGKEIFEGDIMKTTTILASDKIDDIYFNVEVKWNVCGWIANGGLTKYQCAISEVIGNIHENKDLIK